MGMSLSNDLRVRVVEAVLAGSSRRRAAARFGVSVSSAIRWVRLWRERGDVRAKPRGGDRRSGRIEAHAEFLLEQVAQTPDVTLAELQALLFERGVAAGIGTVWRFFDRHQISFKKKTAHAAEQDRPDVAARRLAWFARQPGLDPRRLVFIDETGASTKMARLRGRSKRGQRCRAAVPHGHWKTTTFTAGLRLDGLTAPMLLDGPMNGAAFLAYVEQVLVPTEL